MKKLLSVFLILSATPLFAQVKKDNPMIVIDAQKIGFIKDESAIKEMKAMDENEISTVVVLKDTLISKKYGSDYGVIIITRKKYILKTFYKDFIENSPLKTDLPFPEILSGIGIINAKKDTKNSLYDELSKYIYTGIIDGKIHKIAKITFIKPEDAMKLNPEWSSGALEIIPED